MRSFFPLALAIFAPFTVLACSVSTAPPSSDAPGSRDAAACANVDCGGHGTCRAALASTSTWVASCDCADGFILEHENALACIAASPKTEGSGYRFDPDPSADLVSELATLTGSWFPARGSWTTRADQGDIVESGYVFALPSYAGPASWSAADLSAARAGAAKLLPPESSVVKIGPLLTGDLAGFRPMQFSKVSSPEEATATVLYRRSDEPVGATSRPTLLVHLCDDSLTIGVAKPLIASCVDGARGEAAETFVQDMFASP